MYSVYEKRGKKEVLIYEGTKVNVDEIHKVLEKYYEGDKDVFIETIKKEKCDAKFKNLKEFYKISKYKTILNELDKNKKYKATSSQLGTKYFDTIDECDKFLGGGSIGSVTGIFYAATDEYVESEVPY